MNKWRLEILLAIGICFPFLCLPQTSRFVQAELSTAINPKSNKVGDVVKASAIRSVTLPQGGTISRGAEIFGRVRAVTPTSIAISFDEAELDGKRVPLSLSIRAAMAPGSNPAQASQNTPAQGGSVIGMPGVSLHALSKRFESAILRSDFKKAHRNHRSPASISYRRSIASAVSLLLDRPQSLQWYRLYRMR